MSDNRRKITVDEWYNDIALEVELLGDKNETFLQIMETLTRCGISHNKKLYQSCHILHKKGKYYICHFKELLGLDGKPIDLTEEDINRRNKIAYLLENWGFVKVLWKDKPFDINDPNTSVSVHVISYNDKDEYELIPKYTIGSKKGSKK